VDRANIGVFELALDLGFFHEARFHGFIVPRGGKEHLDGHLASELKILGFDDGAHAAAPDFAFDLIGPEMLFRR
jgi:hypothetical protein